MLKYILCEFYIFALEFTSLHCKLGSWVPEIRDEFLPKVETHQRKVFTNIGFYILVAKWSSLLYKLESWVLEIRVEFLPSVETHSKCEAFGYSSIAQW